MKNHSQLLSFIRSYLNWFVIRLSTDRLIEWAHLESFILLRGLPETVEHVQRRNQERSDVGTHWALSLNKFWASESKGRMVTLWVCLR